MSIGYDHMETNKLVKSRDGSYFSCERFRQVHERLVEERQSKLFWKTSEYSQLYSLLLRGSKPSMKVKQSLFHSKDFIAGRIVPHISYIPNDVEEDFPLYGLLRCWVRGSSVDELYSEKLGTKSVQLQTPVEYECHNNGSCPFSQSKSSSPNLEKSHNYSSKQLLKEHLIRWKSCRRNLARGIRNKRLQVGRSLRGQELLERMRNTPRK